MNNLALYIHWPFCESKCPYCDFNSHVRDEISQENWLEAYLKEIDYYKTFLGNKNITSIFFGGGTPSLMRPDIVEKLLTYIKKTWSVCSDIEITIEANPSSSEIVNFQELKQAGINRLSIGIQSFDDKRLKFLGRRHNGAEGTRAIEMAAKVFDNFSFDIIYNLPEQTKKELKKSLNIALSFGSPHLSLYQLTIEKGTEFFKDFREHKFTLPDEEKSINLYNFVTEECKTHKLERYEISNYAKRGFECAHNLSYWKYDEYLGIGAGAHSRVDIDGKRTAIFDTHNPEKWLEQVRKLGNGVQNRKHLSPKDLIEEMIFMGLRTKLGLNKSNFQKITGRDLEKDIDYNIITSLSKENYIMEETGHLKLTEKSMLLHSAISKRIVNSIRI